MFEALAKFQTAHGLKPTAQLKPNDTTVDMLNKALANATNNYYVWRTVADDKVRASHAALNGALRQWSDSPNPATDYNCRCWAEAVVLPPDPPLNNVYPEAFLLPLLRVGWLYNLWQLWYNAPNTTWRLGQHKSAIRWGNQLKKRNWTPDNISETIAQGTRFKAPNKVNPANQAVRYEYKGRFVVRDETTKEILQISGNNFEKTLN